LTVRWLRAFAILLAIVAIFDPAITSTRRTRPIIALVADESQRALADRVARALDGSFQIVRAPFSGAAGTVLVTDHVPASDAELASPVFTVIPERDGPTATLEALKAPAHAPLDSRVTISAVARVTSANGRTLEVALQAGNVVVDRFTGAISGDDERLVVPLTFVPTSRGTVALRVTANIAGARQTSTADVGVDILERQWAVLFFDARPSWMSTFVRRAIERDPRFVVTSRTMTSRGISTDVGRPPGSLDDVARVTPFDAIIVGAPEALNDRDVAGLDAYLRRRGGGVVLVFDRRASGPYERLTQAGEWAAASGGAGMTVDAVAADSVGLRVSEIAWPARLPAGARPVAVNRAASANAAPDNRAVVWRSAVGAGRLVVSGALDAWRFRAATNSAFDAFWQTLIAETAAASPAAIDIDIATPMLAPGQTTDVVVTLRDITLGDTARRSDRPVHASVTASVEGQATRLDLRLWPDGRVGRFRGSLRAPAAPGTYQVAVSSGDDRAEARIIVATEVSHIAPAEHDLLRAWTTATGGTSLSSSRLEELPSTLDQALRPTPRRVTWHPMRSAWWILPFTIALAIEWWSRRRRGLS
jgi:hypothetical protein